VLERLTSTAFHTHIRSPDPGTHHFRGGLDNPTGIGAAGRRNPMAVALLFGYPFRKPDLRLACLIHV